MRDLTPYDTGERLQPFVWSPNGDRDRYGKVDFENDESSTVAVAWMERDDEGYVLNCYAMGGDLIRVEQWHEDGGPRPLQVVAEPLPEDRLLFMHEQFATAEHEGAKIAWTISPTRTGLSCEVTLADGTRVEETLDLQPMLKAWAMGIIKEGAPREPMYTLCAEPDCPFFIEANSAWDGPGGEIAEYVHLTRGDDADEAREDHEAKPGGPAAPLSWWRERGPERVKERFV